MNERRNKWDNEAQCKRVDREKVSTEDRKEGRKEGRKEHKLNKPRHVRRKET